jgi:hypothetical protein
LGMGAMKAEATGRRARRTAVFIFGRLESNR